MNALTEAQEAEVDELAWDFVQDRKLEGLVCIVILKGRGIRKVAYAVEDRDDVPGMLAVAYRDAAAYKASQAN